MSNTRELLELAALATGRDRWRWCEDDECMIHYDAGGIETYWNPLEDYEDCARMERRLRIDVIWYSASVETRHYVRATDSIIEASEEYAKHKDDDAARRLAVVQVAAEIGRRIHAAAAKAKDQTP